MSFAGILALLGLLAAWRNFTNQQLIIDIARQRTKLMLLSEEIRHFNGLIETAAPYNEVADWAFRTNGWKSRQDQVDTVFVTMTPRN